MAPTSWPIFSRISFRFAFIYYLLYFNPLALLSQIPGVGSVTQFLLQPLEALVYWLNDNLFQVAEVLVPMGGSGDTSFGWAQQFTYLLLAGSGMVIWTVLDWRRPSYPQLGYWLCLLIRYSLAAIAFSYGFIKILAMQMTFPNLSQLATPLGDYLPMRLSWMFIGYSTPYQVFSGVAELLVALLLIWRRTALLGALLAVGVFANVAVLNLSYDIPVKIYSINLFIASLYLVGQEKDRLLAFFILNRPALPSGLYEKTFVGKAKIARIVAKSLFILMSFGMTAFSYIQYYQSDLESRTRVLEPIEPGQYHVELFVKNGDTIPESLADTLRWRDVIFDYDGAGSVSANDSSMRMRYGRAYFAYEPDSASMTLEWRKSVWDSEVLVTFDMELLPENGMILHGKKGEDHLYLKLKKLKRHFPLTERQFHWISEDNR